MSMAMLKNPEYPPQSPSRTQNYYSQYTGNVNDYQKKETSELYYYYNGDDNNNNNNERKPKVKEERNTTGE